MELPSENQEMTSGRHCVICGDWGSGKHYGALTCFGCKGFFQRTVRKGLFYVCRFNGGCEITKNRRNQCRYCRFKKCLDNNMRRESVQEERDRMILAAKPEVGQQNQVSIPLAAAAAPTNGLLVSADVLMQADVAARLQSNCVNPNYALIHGNRVGFGLQEATVQDIYDGLKTEVHNAVEFAKFLPGFRDLDMADQMALLRNNSAALCVFESVRRSVHVEDMCVLANGKVTLRDKAPTVQILFARRRIIDELAKPCRDLKVDDAEFLCLKALMMFDPLTVGLQDTETVGRIRHEVQLLLESLVDKKERGNEGSPSARLSSLLLLLPRIYSTGVQMVETTRSSKLFGVANIHRLVNEVLLGEEDSSEVNGSGTEGTLNNVLVNGTNTLPIIPSFHQGPQGQSISPPDQPYHHHYNNAGNNINSNDDNPVPLEVEVGIQLDMDTYAMSFNNEIDDATMSMWYNTAPAGLH